MRLQRWRHPCLDLLAAILCAAATAAAHAQDAGRFEVRNAYVEPVEGDWLLNVRLDLALADAARQPFDEGVRLEREGFMALMQTPESRALRHVFAAERVKSQISRPSKVQPCDLHAVSKSRRDSVSVM